MQEAVLRKGLGGGWLTEVVIVDAAVGDEGGGGWLKVSSRMGCVCVEARCACA